MKYQLELLVNQTLFFKIVVIYSGLLFGQVRQVKDCRCCKGLTRFNRDTGASRLYHLTLNTPIKCKDVTLKVSRNKEQLIQLIFNYLVANTILILPHKLTASGRDPVPLQILSQIISRCENL